MCPTYGWNVGPLPPPPRRRLRRSILHHGWQVLRGLGGGVVRRVGGGEAGCLSRVVRGAGEW